MNTGKDFRQALPSQIFPFLLRKGHSRWSTSSLLRHKALVRWRLTFWNSRCLTTYLLNEKASHPEL